MMKQVKEGEPRPEQKKPKLEFGHPLNKRQRQGELFPEGDDLPLFSGTPQEVIDRPFVPEDQFWKQEMLPGMPGIDYDVVLAKDRALRRRRQGVVPSKMQNGDIFTTSAASISTEAAPAEPEQEITIYHATADPPAQREPPGHMPVLSTPRETTSKEQRRARKQADDEPDTRAQQLREALVPYLDVRRLRRLASDGANLHEALISPNPPKEVLALVDTLAAMLRPVGRDQITSPADIASLLMVEMGHLTQEQLRVVCLNTVRHEAA